ncbi:MAG: Mpo1-like protein [Leptospiraceae bacterium]|nr:Mpo1-like protein [Leptospiraceae bacterium]
MNHSNSKFFKFYQDVFLKEHSHNGTIILHIIGTILGILWIPFTVFYLPIYLILLFPVVHALPGIIGHRIFERNENVGDLRVLRKDFPLYWFIIANHILTYEILFLKSIRKTKV